MTRRFFGVLVLILLCAFPAFAQDAIDLSRAQIVNAPDVRTWAPTARITRVSFSGGVTRVAFTKQDGDGRWPDVTPPGWSGPLQYTLWLFVKTGDGSWAGSGFIQFWHGRDGSGSAADPDLPSVYDKHWYYAERWSPIFGHGQIQPGEQIGFMVTSGNERDSGGPFSVQERSNVVVFAATDNGAYNFDATLPPVVVTPPPVIVVPPTTTVPQPLPLPPLTVSTDYTALLNRILDAQLQLLDAQKQLLTVSQDTNKQVGEMNKTLGQTLGQVATFVGKYVGPAIAAFVAGKKL